MAFTIGYPYLSALLNSHISAACSLISILSYQLHELESYACQTNHFRTLMTMATRCLKAYGQHRTLNFLPDLCEKHGTT